MLSRAKVSATQLCLPRSGHTADSLGAVEEATAVAVPQGVNIAARLDMEPLPQDFTPDQRLLTGERRARVCNSACRWISCRTLTLIRLNFRRQPGAQLHWCHCQYQAPTSI